MKLFRWFKVFTSNLVKEISSFWKQYNPFGRMFWSISLALSFCGMGISSFYTMQKYYSDPVSMTVDTEYLYWNSSFPSISICLVKGKTTSMLDPIIMKQNISFKGSKTNFLRTVHICMFTNNPHMELDQLRKCDELQSVYGIIVEDLKKLLLPENCNGFMDFLYYNNETFNCSDVLKFHKTEVGYCFIANSIIDYEYSFENLKLKFKYSTKTAKLSMSLKMFGLWDYSISIHSPEEVPVFNSVSKQSFSAQILLSYNIAKILTDIDASKKSIKERGCRFAHERLRGSPFHYSFSLCLSFLRIQLELENCNCTLSTAPETYSSNYCDLSGRICLLKSDISKKVSYRAMKENICVPSCTEQILQNAGQNELSEDNKINGGFTDIAVEIINIPTARYKRAVTRTKLDLAVSIAGLAGLFFGVSVLNLVEVIYYLTSTNRAD